MFFSIASRLTVSSSGAASAKPCAARKRFASPRANSSSRMPVGTTVDGVSMPYPRSTAAISLVGTIR